MYVLLEPGMIIRHDDEALSDGSHTWDFAGLAAGTPYRETHLIMRREVETIQDLQDLKPTGDKP